MDQIICDSENPRKKNLKFKLKGLENARIFPPETNPYFENDTERHDSYIAPELSENWPTSLDHSADIWSIGVLVYHLLTLSLPFERQVPSIAARSNQLVLGMTSHLNNPEEESFSDPGPVLN